MSDTITIPRDLFNALCEAAIDRECELRRYQDSSYERWRQKYEHANEVMIRAVAIRDALDKDLDIG